MRSNVGWCQNRDDVTSGGKKVTKTSRKGVSNSLNALLRVPHRTPGIGLALRSACPSTPILDLSAQFGAKRKSRRFLRHVPKYCNRIRRSVGEHVDLRQLGA